MSQLYTPEISMPQADQLPDVSWGRVHCPLERIITKAVWLPSKRAPAPPLLDIPPALLRHGDDG